MCSDHLSLLGIQLPLELVARLHGAGKPVFCSLQALAGLLHCLSQLLDLTIGLRASVLKALNHLVLRQPVNGLGSLIDV